MWNRIVLFWVEFLDVRICCLVQHLYVHVYYLSSLEYASVVKIFCVPVSSWCDILVDARMKIPWSSWIRFEFTRRESGLSCFSTILWTKKDSHPI